MMRIMASPDEGSDGAGVAREFARQPAIAADPGQGAFDDPSAWAGRKHALKTAG